jgi:hypothetical protein
MELDVKSKSPLNWEVFVTPGIPVATSDVPPGQKQRTYSPISSTLIYGKHDAVLVDAFPTYPAYLLVFSNNKTKH